jgi:chromosome segregation ATPase
MAKKASDNTPSAVPTDEIQKQRKKQAKREAKAMLAVEEGKADVQKAEKKLAKAQAQLEARTARLHTLEAELAELRASHEELEVSVPDAGFGDQTGQPELEEATQASVPDTGFDHQTGQPELEYEKASSNQPEQEPPSELYQETEAASDTEFAED